MSTSLVKKALTLLEADSDNRNQRPKKNSIPEHQKVIKKIYRKGKKAKKVNVLSKSSKATVLEVRSNRKSKDQVIEENLKKLKLLKEISTLKLDKDLTKTILKRAVGRRPVKEKKASKPQTTAFTEEDFKKFEAEYLNE